MLHSNPMASVDGSLIPVPSTTIRALPAFHGDGGGLDAFKRRAEFYGTQSNETSVVVEREDALKLLASESQVERLRAARALRGLFTESDRPAIEAALKVESDAWERRCPVRDRDP